MQPETRTVYGRLKSTIRPWALMSVAVGLTVVGCGSVDPDAVIPKRTAPVVTDDVLTQALLSERPARLTMTDEIEHFCTRLGTAGGKERLARGRLVAAHLLRFRAYGDGHDLEEARHHLAVLEAESRASPTLLALRSSMQLLDHDFGNALETAREANKLSGEFDSSLRLRLFDARWAIGQYSAAEDLLDLPHDRAEFAYLVREARVLDRRGDTAAARDNLVLALDEARAYAQPASVIAWALTELGHFESHSGRPRAAVRRYLESLESLPGNPAALEGLARLAAGIDRNPGVAMALFARALRNGGHLDLYVDLASSAEASGEHHKAALARARFVERATSSSDSERQYARPLALVLADHYPGRLPEALRYAERDFDRRPTLESWDTIAWVRYRLGDLGGALAASRRATGWGVSEPIILYHSGVIADVGEEAARAAELLAAALEVSGELTTVQVEEIQRRLRDLEH